MFSQFSFFIMCSAEEIGENVRGIIDAAVLTLVICFIVYHALHTDNSGQLKESKGGVSRL